MSEHPIVAPTNNVPYIVAVVACVGLTIAAIVTITVMRPEQDNAIIIGQIVAAAGPVTLALLAFMKSQETHLSVNSRLEEFKKAIEESSALAGEKRGIEIGKRQQVDIEADVARAVEKAGET